MPMYRLRRNFFDGSKLYKKGEIVAFSEAEAPKTAVKMEAEAKPAPAEPELPFALSEVTPKTGTVGAKAKK